MTYAADIPLSLAVAAHSGTSFVPEKRGASELSGYAAHLAAVREKLEAHAVKGGTLGLLDEVFERYRAGYRARTLAQLSSRSRCLSMMIAGPSNFPVRRQEKRNRIERKRLEELIAFQEYGLQKAISTLRPDLRPIMSGDADALERLGRKIAEAEMLQARMKAINAAHAKYLKDPAWLDTAELSDADKATIRDYKPGYSWEPHPFAPFELKNNNANIRRMRERFAMIERAQATPDTDAIGNGITLADRPAENRIKLTFPGKPGAAVRARLKGCGFRWTPSQGLWQAYRNGRTLELARSMVQEEVS